MESSAPDRSWLAFNRGHKVAKDTYAKVMDDLASADIRYSGVALDMYAREKVFEHFNLISVSHETDPTNPMPLVTVNPHLDNHRHHPVRHEIKKLLGMQAPKELNMSLMDILNVDTVTYDIIIEELRLHRERTSKVTGKALSDLDDLEDVLKG